MTSPLETPLTVSSLVEEVLDVVHGYARDQEQRTALTGTGLTSNGLTFTVSNVNQISRGIVEIDTELVYVGALDPATNTATIEPWGRAQSGSAAAAHSVGARVTMAPLFPRQRVANAVFGVLREMFPSVFPVGETLLDINPAQTNYPLPADAYHVLSVEWNLPGPSGMWLPVPRWRQNKPAGAIEVEILSGVWPGTDRVRVTYVKVPAPTYDFDDDLAAEGFDYQVRDLIVLGAAAKLMAYTESARVLAESVESHGRSEAVPVTSATQLSRYLYQLFQKRLDDERAQILLRHPMQPHRTR